METKVKLDKNTFEVKAQKVFTMGKGAAGGYAFISEADYYIVTDQSGVSLKSNYLDVEYNTPIEDLDSYRQTFKINNKEYKYQIID